MNRRDFCKSLGTGALALALLKWARAGRSEASVAAPAAAATKPNIIFILSLLKTPVIGEKQVRTTVVLGQISLRMKWCEQTHRRLP